MCWSVHISLDWRPIFLLPVQICAGLHLKVFGNSTRPAPATAKLGYQGCPTPLCVPLSTLHPQGGLVGCLDIVVVRKYPLMVSHITSLRLWLMTVKNASLSMWSALFFCCCFCPSCWEWLLSGLGENFKRWLALEKCFFSVHSQLMQGKTLVKFLQKFSHQLFVQ